MPLLDVFWTMLWFFVFVLWIWLVISVFIDIFRSDMSGVSKALWVVFVILLPFLGVFIYLIVHGSDMQARAGKQAAQRQEAQAAYMQTAGGTSSADELTKLSDLHDKGALTDEEYAAQKQKVLGA